MAFKIADAYIDVEAKLGRDGLSGLQRELSKAGATIDVDVNVSDARSQINKLDGEVIEAELAIDTSSAEGALSQMFGGMKGGAGGGASSLLGAAKGGGPWAVAGGAAAAGVVYGFNEYMNREQLSDQAAAAFGLSPEQAQENARIASSVYAGAWGDSLGEVSTNVAMVQQQVERLGTGEDIEPLVGVSMDLADVMGTDLNGVLETSRQLVANGLAPDLESAFDILATGQQNGLNTAGDLLDTLHEYAPAFGRLGLDGEDALNLINTGLENGILNTDKIGDAINEFSIRAIDGSESTADAYRALGLDAEDTAEIIANGGEGAQEMFETIIEGLGNIEDPLERDAAGVALFGSMWEDMGEEAILSLGDTEDAIGDTEGAAKGLSDTLNSNLKTKLESLKRQGLEKLANFTVNTVIPALQDFARWVDEKVVPVVKDFAGAVEAFWERTEPIWEKVYEISEIVIRGIIEGFEALGEIISGFAKIFEGIMEGDLSKVWEGVRQMFKGAVDALINQIRTLVDSVVALLGSLPGKAWDALRALPGTLMNMGLDAMYRMKDGLLWAWGSVKDWLLGLPGLALSFLSSLPGKFASLGSDVMKALKDGLIWYWSNVTGWLSGIPTGMWNAARGAVSTFWNLGRDIMNALWDGLKSLWGSIWSWISGKVSDLWNAVNPVNWAKKGAGWVGGLMGFADGGRPPVGIPSVVGEEGPELFIPDRPGTIIPNHQLGTHAAAGGSMPSGTSYGNVYVTISASDMREFKNVFDFFSYIERAARAGRAA